MSTTPPRIIIVPGWRNSGVEHWQSLWAQALPHAERVDQEDWLTPKRKTGCVLWRPCCCRALSPPLWWRTVWGALRPPMSQQLLQRAFAAHCWWLRQTLSAELIWPTSRRCPTRPCLIAVCWLPVATIHIVLSAWREPMHGHGAVNLCGCKTQATLMLNQVMAAGRWALSCFNRCCKTWIGAWASSRLRLDPGIESTDMRCQSNDFCSYFLYAIFR